MEFDEQRLIDQILLDARENAKSILNEARTSADTAIKREKERAMKNAEDEINSILKRGEDEAEGIRRTAIADTKLKASWTVLSEKQRLVTSVIDKAKSRLVSFTQSKEYMSLLQRLIVDAGVILDGEELEVVLRGQDVKLPLDLSVLVQAIEEKTGKETELNLSTERIESLGGCIVRTRDGRIMIDNTFPAILKRRERKLRRAVMKILFHE